MTEELDTPEIKNETIINNTVVSNDPIDEIESAFENFNKTNSEFQVEEQQQPDPSDPTEIDLSDAETFKLQIFISLMFTLLDGLHVFIYGFMSKYKLTRDDIGLDESDKAGLEIYFKTQRVMDLINRLPVEVIGFLHIEYMYFNKFREFNKKMKESEPEEEEQAEEYEELELEEPEEKEEPETTEEKILKVLQKKQTEFAEKKPEVKKVATKKATPKKAEVKKVATKKAVKKAPKKAEVKTTPEENK